MPLAPTRTELQDLAVRGNDVPVRATLRLNDEPRNLLLSAPEGERQEVLRLPAGDYWIVRGKDRCALTGADGTPLFRADGDRSVVAVEDGMADITDGRLDFQCCVPEFLERIDPDRHDILDPRYTVGKITSVEYEGRAAWLLTRQDTRVTVDASTGVLLAVSSRGESGELVALEFPDDLDDDEFSWTGDTVPARPWGTDRAEALFHVELNRLEVPEPQAPPAEHRVLPVQVDTWMIEDSSGPQPTLGDTVDLVLQFTEDGDGDHYGAEVVTLDAWAEEAEGTCWQVERGSRRGDEFRWRTILRGDGWSALWEANRPVTGNVHVRGSLHHDGDIMGYQPLPPTRGAVSRIRMVGEGHETDVGKVRLPFPYVDHFTVNWIGFTMDLDDAERPEPTEHTPSWFSGFAVTGNGRRRMLWRADPLLPMIWRTELETGVTSSLALPLKMSEAGRFRQRIIMPDGDGVRVRTGKRDFRVGIATDGAGSTDHTVTEIPVPDAVSSADNAVTVPDDWGGGWVISDFGEMEEWTWTLPGTSVGIPVTRGVQRLGRVDESGESNWLYEEKISDSSRRARLLSAGGHVMTWQDDVVRYLDSELQVVREAALPDAVGDGHRTVQTAGIYIAVSADVRSTDGTTGNGEGLRMTVLEPGTLDVVFSQPCGWRAHVQVDDRDSVWLADEGGLRLFTRDDVGRWKSEPYDSL